MKTIITISVLILTKTFMFSQPYQQMKSIEGGDYAETGVYYKDINNVFDDFEGTYVYEGNGIYLKFILQKKELSYNNWYWQDMLIGGYQYKLIGVGLESEVINCLNDVNIPIIDGKMAKLGSSWIRDPEENKFCDDCLSAKWLKGWIKDPISNRNAEVYMARKLHNGQPALYVWLYLYGASLPSSEPRQPFNLPTGQSFTMIKID